MKQRSLIRNFFVSIAALALCGCVDLTDRKIDNDGYYRFKKEPIEVKAPTIGDITVFDTDNSVDFTVGAGYWMIAGQYAVQVLPLPVKMNDREKFLKKSSTEIKNYILQDRETAGFKVEFLKGEIIEVNGHAAYRAIGVDRRREDPAVFIATSILLNKRIVIGSCLYPLNKLIRNDWTDMSSWKTYNEWIATIRETDVTTP
ncbi:MAG TPA: hypothetical protein VK717_11105 [Opitutaceae bacterium]|jgi:hypothetical protein|nr:hypothetical protein [Opitutaceae bacterium]